MAIGFNTQVGNGEYRLQFETNNKEHYLLMQEAARRCVDGKSKTNAERIRSMSDEELAAMLKDYKDCNKNCIISNGKRCYQICEEESVLLKWLQQPAEEEAYSETD